MEKKMPRSASLLQCAVALLVALPASAGVISGNIGSAPPFYQTDSGSPFGDLLGVSAIANGFVPNTDAQLATIQLPISIFDLAEPNQLNISLTSDAGFSPGLVIESFDITGQMGLFGDTNPLIV